MTQSSQQKAKLKAPRIDPSKRYAMPYPTNLGRVYGNPRKIYFSSYIFEKKMSSMGSARVSFVVYERKPTVFITFPPVFQFQGS